MCLGRLYSAISSKEIVVIIINKYLVTKDRGVNLWK